MKVKELIIKLSELTDEQKEMDVIYFDDVGEQDIVKVEEWEMNIYKKRLNGLMFEYYTEKEKTISLS